MAATFPKPITPVPYKTALIAEPRMLDTKIWMPWLTTLVRLVNLFNTYVLVSTGVKVSDLPGSPIIGQLAQITDSSTTTWGATVTGLGGNKVLAWFNGTNWTVVGK